MNPLFLFFLTSVFAADPTPKWTYGHFSRSCSPSAGTALTFVLRPRKFECTAVESRKPPFINLKIWSSQFFSSVKSGGEYTFGQFESFTGSICLTEKCETFRTLHFKIKIYTDSLVEGEIEGVLEHGEKYGPIPVKFSFCQRRVFCG